jgi:hypothetical protein
MVAAANTSRPRYSSSASARKPRISAGVLVMIGVPVLLVLTLAWQFGSNILHNEIAVRDAVAVSSVSLEADPVGSRIDLVLVDRVGQDTSMSGNLTVKLREPDGTLWQTTRAVGNGDFIPISDGGLLNGRTGYSVLVPATDWLRAPRRGGAATVTVTVEPNNGVAFSTVIEQRFP